LSNKPKSVYIKTYGCQMNVYDSKRILEILNNIGYNEVPAVNKADLIVLNTCHIRDKAAEKVYSDLGRFASKKKTTPDTKIILAGCVAQAEGEEIFKRQPLVDLVIGPQTYHRLPELLSKIKKNKDKAIDTSFPTESKFDYLLEERKDKGPVSFISIQEGCDKFCTFCVVPYTRGAEYSRPVEKIINESKKLIEKGARELVLLGQNVNAYHGQDSKNRSCSLADLLFLLSKIDGVERLRYTTSHPSDVTEDLIAAHKDIEVLMPYLHLPVQSGSDKVLKLMNRNYSFESYSEIIKLLRKARPDIAISSDFIVGFPGETDIDFYKTIELVKKINFSQSYSFKYSIRPGTPASLMDGQVEVSVKNNRLKVLQKVLDDQQMNFNNDFVGLDVDVLFDRIGKKKNQIIGRTPWMQAVHVDGSEELLGLIRSVKIIAAGPKSLAGKI